MAKKKHIQKEDIISNFMEYVLLNNKKPDSVYSFSKQYNFNEEDYYKFYGNFSALEQSIFKVFYEKTINLLEKNNEYQNYSSRDKMLSFYYSFFELLTANRSYVVHALGSPTKNLKKIDTLKKLKKSFSNYIDKLDITLLETNQETLDKIQNKTLKESAWFQLLLTIKYWLEDTSPSFERTDIFIEKAVNTSFDLINIKPLKSVLDLGKFLYKDKSFMN
ncbi:MAG: TetR/AcrR family transcriptional regulator [Flavobacteriales bacterium]|nr:MAG: TetR/AcrR family transcriptional regulator [Flavobacteriales bacterium]